MNKKMVSILIITLFLLTVIQTTFAHELHLIDNDAPGPEYKKVSVSGSWAFVSCGSDGLSIYYMGNHTMLTTVDDGYYYRDVDSPDGEYIACAVGTDDNTTSLLIYRFQYTDWSTYSLTLIAGTSDISGDEYYTVDWDDAGTGYIYTGCGTDGIFAYSYDYDTNLTLLATQYDGGSYSGGISFDSFYVYACSYGAGLYSYGFNGVDFTLTDTASDGGAEEYQDVVSDNTYVYTAVGSVGTIVYSVDGVGNLSNNNFTEEITMKNGTSDYRSVSCNATLVLYACETTGVQVYTAWDGATLELLASSYNGTTEDYVDTCTNDDEIISVANSDGIFFYNLTGEGGGPVLFPPEVETRNASMIRETSAMLNGKLTSEDATVWFEWGHTTAYGNTTSNQTRTEGDVFYVAISNLSYNTTYHFRAVANNSEGTDYGNDFNFTTSRINLETITLNVDGMAQNTTTFPFTSSPNVGYSLWQNIDENVADGNTSYLFATNTLPGNKNYSFWTVKSAGSHKGDTIAYVEAYFVLQSSDYNPATSDVSIILTTSMPYFSPWTYLDHLNSEYTIYSVRYDKDPNNGVPVPWTWTGVNNIILGIMAEMHSTVRITRAWAEVVYLNVQAKGGVVVPVGIANEVIRIPDVMPPKYATPAFSVPEMYQLLHADKLPKSDAEVTVMVIDSGLLPITYNNIQLNKISTIKGAAINNQFDENGHGTWVNYAVAYMLQTKVPHARQISYRVFGADGSCTTSEFIAALETAKQMHVDIVSISAGVLGTEDDAFAKACEDLRNNGIIVIVAAGNFGPSPGSIASPGISDGVIAVAASDPIETGQYTTETHMRGVLDLHDDIICSWSSRGPITGVQKPDVTAPGESIIGPWLYEERLLSGTSMATPLISGGAALVIANNKLYVDIVRILYFWDKTTIPQVFEDSIKASCFAKGDANSWGTGIVQFEKVNENFQAGLFTKILIALAVIFIIILVLFFIYRSRHKSSGYKVPKWLKK